MVTVTCAIIKKDGKVLVVKRGPTMKLPLKWEFPGGKIEHNESPEQCIIREISEELQIHIKLANPLTPVIHKYAELEVQLIPFIAEYLGGTLILTEHIEYKWLDNYQLLDLDWAEADISILHEYLSL